MKRSELKKKTVAELAALARSVGLSAYSGLRKAELVEKLARAARKQGTNPGKQPAKAKAAPKQTKKPAGRAAGAARKRATKPVKRAAKRRPAERARPAALSPRTRRAFSACRTRGEQRIKASKYYLGVTESPELDEAFAYPETHGENVVTLMVRDPYWLFAYWEFSPSLRDELFARIGEEAFLRSRFVLRVYDVTRTEPDRPVSYHDIDIAPEARNWYINVMRVEREYCVDVGLITPDGSFIVIARSNRVSLPPVGPSDVVDEEWVTMDALDDLYARSARERGPSSGSGGWGSGGSGR